jgi:dihydroorotase
LNQNKLIVPNYVDWKLNLDIVLTAKVYKFVLTKTCPNDPVANASKGVRQQFDCWKKFDEMTKCYILVYVPNVILHQL